MSNSVKEKEGGK